MLDDVGKLKTLSNIRGQSAVTVRVIMVIKAPRGECQIYEYPGECEFNDSHDSLIESQCQAIKAFMEFQRSLVMEEHSND